MSSKPADLSTSDPELTRRARRAFFVNLFDMTWRLAGAMLAPMFIGLFIDSRMSGGGQGFALAGFAVGMIFGVIVIKSIVVKLQKETA